jgi:hypothetical protein
MLRGQVAVYLSCSEKFKEAVAWPIRDALAGHGLRGIIVSDEPPLPCGGSPDANADAYLDAASAFVALCAADYELSDGSKYPRANVVEEIQRALGRPHLRDRAQILKAPGVLLPSDITPTYDGLDVAKPGAAAEVVLKQLQQWGMVGAGQSPAVGPHQVGAAQPDDVAAILAGPPPAGHDEACQRVYRLLRDRSQDRRRWIAGELCREVMDAGREARALAAAALLRAVSGIDATLVPDEMIEALAAHPRYQARACAAHLLRGRAEEDPLRVPVEVLGRLARPGAEDWLVWAPAMAAVQELVLHRRDANVILQSLAASADPRDRFAAAAALLAVAGARPEAVSRALAGKLASDADDLVAAMGAEVMAATEHVTERQHAQCYRRFWDVPQPAE